MPSEFYHSFPEFDIAGKLPEKTLERKWKNCEVPGLNGKTVLDIGAWSGWYSLRCANEGAQVVAIDTHARSIENIKKINKLSGKNIDAQILDVMDLNKTCHLGKFDVVLFLGVLYHLQHPLLGLQNCYSATRELCIIETHIADPRNKRDSYMKFIPGKELNNDPTNWWAPTIQCVLDMCTASGFAKAELINQHHARAVFHAYV